MTRRSFLRFLPALPVLGLAASSPLRARVPSAVSTVTTNAPQLFVVKNGVIGLAPGVTAERAAAILNRIAMWR